MLCLHSGAVRIADRNVLRTVDTPRGSGRWKPIAHYQLAESAINRAGVCGLEVEKEEWALGGSENARLYGVLKFRQHPKIGMPPGMAPCMGIRSSLDKSVAIGIAIGATVFCCDNGALVGDFSIRKLHTTGFRLNAEMDHAFKRFSEQAGALKKMVEGLEGRKLSKKDSNHLIMEAFRQDVMPWRYAGEVVKEYYEPQHDQFKPRNAWSLYNAFTEVVKRRSPADQLRTFRALNKFLVESN